MIFGVFDSTAEFLEVLGVWLAATATFIAAFVALSVANRATRQTINVVAQPAIEVLGNASKAQNPIFLVSATNTGTRPVKINNICIRSRFPNYNAILMADVPGSSPMPVQLNDGETANWRFPETLPDGRDWYEGFANHTKDFGRIARYRFPKSLRFYVVTTLGNQFYAPQSTEFAKKLRKRIEELDAP